MKRRTFLTTLALAASTAVTSCSATVASNLRGARPPTRDDFERLDAAIDAIGAMQLATRWGCARSACEALDASARITLRTHLLVGWFRELDRVARYDARVQSRMWGVARRADAVVLDAEDTLAHVAIEPPRSFDRDGLLRLFDSRAALAGFDEKQRRSLARTTRTAIDGLESAHVREWIAERIRRVEKARREVDLSLRRTDRNTRLGTGARALGLTPLQTASGLTVIGDDNPPGDPLDLPIAALVVRLGALPARRTLSTAGQFGLPTSRPVTELPKSDSRSQLA
jgi:hypothetical protein